VTAIEPSSFQVSAAARAVSSPARSSRSLAWSFSATTTAWRRRQFIHSSNPVRMAVSAPPAQTTKE